VSGVALVQSIAFRCSAAANQRKCNSLNRKQHNRMKRAQAKREVFWARQKGRLSIVDPYIPKGLPKIAPKQPAITPRDNPLDRKLGKTHIMKTSNPLLASSMLCISDNNVLAGAAQNTEAKLPVHAADVSLAVVNSHAMQTKKPQQPCYSCRNYWHVQMCSHIAKLDILGRAPSDGCTVAHMISQCELDEIVAHGAMVIHLNEPMWDQVTDNISWRVVTQGVLNTDGKTLLTCNAVFVTTYNQLQHDPKIIFLGSYYLEWPAADDWVLLALVMQRVEPSVGVDDGCIDVGQVYSQCYESKPNIVDGNNSNHHGSHGGIYGFGARQDFGGIKEMNGSSLGQYVCFEGQEAVAGILERKVIEQI